VNRSFCFLSAMVASIDTPNSSAGGVYSMLCSETTARYCRSLSGARSLQAADGLE
jgi:hypothetical protein